MNLEDKPGAGGVRPSRSSRSPQLRVDLAARRVVLKGKEVRLTRTEYQLLALLVRYAGKVVTHRQILTEVLRVYMGHLRHELEDQPANPRYLLTEMGVGYRLADE